MLLVGGGRSIPRDVLSEALWPGADPDLTAKRVYVLIHALRRAIEPALQPHKRRWTYICSDGDRYYFNPDSPQRCDIFEFRSFIKTGEQQEITGKLDLAIKSYAAALDLYSGDLLEDEPYADWCWAERENLRETALIVAEKVGTQYSKWGAEDQSIAYYKRALRIDPLREQIHRGLIQSLLSAGRRAEALRQYVECAQILDRELGIEPLPETQRLYSQASESRTDNASAF
jgi:DNA-binding SARP family transcriptional activator